MARGILLLAAFTLLQFSIASGGPPMELTPALHMDSCDSNNSNSDDGQGFCPASPLASARQADGLVVRQTRRCVDPGYLPCPNDQLHCCPPDYNCCRNNCCKKGSECCTEGCKLPGGECCGNFYSCPPGSKCAKVDGRQMCQRPCPEVTTTTTTVTRTDRERKTKTVTQTAVGGDEEEQPEGFSCVPLTVTNSLGDTLELGDDCGLTFEPGDGSQEKSSSSSEDPLRKRDRDCPPTRTTRTVYATVSQTDVRTVTATVTQSDSALPEFSCPPMTVTNEFGDELSLDEQCALEFSPGDPTSANPENGDSPSQPTNTGGSGRLTVPTGYLVMLFGGISVGVVWSLW